MKRRKLEREVRDHLFRLFVAKVRGVMKRRKLEREVGYHLFVCSFECYWGL